MQRLVVEILAEQAELPELIGDVLADVGDGAVRAHDDLVVLVTRRRSENAAAGITQQPLFLPSVSKIDRLALLQQLERRRPELAGAGFRFRAAARRTRRPAAAWSSRCARTMASATMCASSATVALAGFDGVQRLGAPCERFGIGPCNRRRCARRGPSRDSRSAAARASAGDLGGRLLLEVVKADDDIGHLHAGVVDVVLHLDALARARAACGRTCRRAPRCAGGRCARPCSD